MCSCSNVCITTECTVSLGQPHVLLMSSLLLTAAPCQRLLLSLMSNPKLLFGSLDARVSTQLCLTTLLLLLLLLSLLSLSLSLLFLFALPSPPDDVQAHEGASHRLPAGGGPEHSQCSVGGCHASLPRLQAPADPYSTQQGHCSCRNAWTGCCEGES